MLSIQQRLGVSLVALVSISYGLLIATNEVVIRRDRLQRHERLVMATAMAIEQHLKSPGGASLTRQSALDEQVVQAELNDFSATRVLVWLSRPQAQPIFPSTRSVKEFLLNKPLLEMAGVNAAGMQKPRSFSFKGETYFTCSMPLPNGLGVLRFLEDVGVSPASRRDNASILFVLWLLLVLISALLIRQLTSAAIRPLLSLQSMMDDLSLQPSGVVGGERLSADSQPLELRGIANSYNLLAERLQKAWTQQQLLMRAVSHELLTPITLIGSNARRLGRRVTGLPDSERYLLDNVQAEASRVDRLVRDLLDLARGDSGKLSLRLVDFALVDVVRESLKDAEALPWGSRVRFDQAISVELTTAMVKGDPERLRQCLLNVLENAAKYSPADQPIDLRLTTTETTAQIRVEDRGKGIPAEERELIFQPFYRSNETRGQEAGSGIGLAIVRLLMERMGGSVTVVDCDHQGTAMQFELPMVDADA